ncbi:hemolysin family protein [Antarctobacter sp.]|uniref:hemolysin family protein n=1 Tax=Antarctobacter sp. TaxID=1872577 RepID=UPI002B26479A|nr:hemolysin family protein [Antarctobacter sp.]
MGDSEDSSKAAQRALGSGQMNVHGPRHGFWQRIFGRIGGGGSQDGTAKPSTTPSANRPIHGMINLRRMRVEDVAIPKAEIIAVPNTITKDDLVSVFRDSGLTRLPVYDGTLDTPVGMAHLKDFALQHGFNGTGGRFNLKRLLRPLLFVPPSMPIGVLLTKMQTERRHMALVIDEYGGVDGLVTIEDLIEQVIGEIEDEHDTEEDQYWTREKSGCYLVQAKTPLTDFEAELGLTLTDHDTIDEEEIDTLGGLVFMLAGRVPARGEVVPHPVGLDFEVVDADPRRIKRLRVRSANAARPDGPSGHAATPVPAQGAQSAKVDAGHA